MNEIYDFFLEAYSNSPTYVIVLELFAFVFGIISVVYAKKEKCRGKIFFLSCISY